MGGVCMPPLMALAARKGSGSDAMASVMALMTIAHSAGMLIGALLGGLAMDVLSLRWVFPAGALAMLAGTVQFLCRGGAVETPQEEHSGLSRRLASGASSAS